MSSKIADEDKEKVRAYVKKLLELKETLCAAKSDTEMKTSLLLLGEMVTNPPPEFEKAFDPATKALIEELRLEFKEIKPRLEAEAAAINNMKAKETADLLKQWAYNANNPSK